MTSSILRNCRIFYNQWRDLPSAEFLSLLRKALFLDEPILVYMRDAVQLSAQHSQAVEGMVFAKGDVAELEGWKNTLQPLPWEFQCHLFDGVEDFFVARNDDGIQHISWIYTNRHRNRLLALRDGEVEIKFCLTLPAWRGRGLYPQTLQSIIDHLRAQGMRRVFICVHRDNRASVRGIEKAGFRRVGELRLRKILGMQISPRFDTTRVP